MKFLLHWFRTSDWQQFAFGLITRPVLTWHLLKAHVLLKYEMWKVPNDQG